MSRLRFRERPTPLPAAPVATSASVSNYQFVIEAVPVPVGTNEYDPEKVKAQAAALTAFRQNAKDLFEPNGCACVTNAGSRLYQTQETYGTALSVEQMVDKLNTHQLTMRVNFRRPGIHSSTTCMELSPEMLTRLLNETPDSKGRKSLELRVKAEAHVAVPRHGAIFVTAVAQGPVHTLSTIDYKIMASYDQMYHSN